MSVVSMDCEMVGCDHGNMLARVSIVDRNGSILLDEFVKPTATVTDYRTQWSGIKKEHLADGKSLSYVQSKVSNILSGKVLVGHSLENDLKVLGLPHPEGKRRDLAKYETFMNNNQSQSLQFLAKKYLNKTIQAGEHSSVEDAKAAMEIYNLFANKWN